MPPKKQPEPTRTVEFDVFRIPVTFDDARQSYNFAYSPDDPKAEVRLIDFAETWPGESALATLVVTSG